MQHNLEGYADYNVVQQPAPSPFLALKVKIVRAGICWLCLLILAVMATLYFQWDVLAFQNAAILATTVAVLGLVFSVSQVGKLFVAFLEHFFGRDIDGDKIIGRVEEVDESEHFYYDDGETKGMVTIDPPEMSRLLLLAFTQQFIFNESDWTRKNYMSRNPRRQYLKDGVPDHLGRQCLEILASNNVVIGREQGITGRRASHVRNIEDVKRIIPYLVMSGGEVVV